MKRKFIIIILLGFMILNITGCDTNKKEESAEKENTKEEVKPKNEDKEIICKDTKDTTSQDAMEYDQSFVFHFHDDKATTFDLVQNIKLIEDNEANRKQFESVNEEYFKTNFKSMFEYAEIELPDFDVKVNDKSDTEKEITVTFDYQNFIKLFAKENEEDLNKYMSFDDFKKHAISELGDDMTCSYNGEVLNNKKTDE